MAETLIQVKTENCSGCMRCCLACSFYNTMERVFSLAESQIVVTPDESNAWFSIDFREDCLGCGICVEHCDFGALIE
ncbi:MAG: 4Fe-4S binding protein [Proteobacteria bacterium]|nr:4Fe-4S binding protein [Pseudomonadota bacterium]